jgi:hypothetical protein
VRFESGSRLERIDDCVFEKCKNLKEISLPARLESVGEKWLKGTRLARVIFESGESLREMLEMDEIVSCEDAQIYVPRSDRELVYPGYVVRDCPDVPGLVALEKSSS